MNRRARALYLWKTGLALFFGFAVTFAAAWGADVVKSVPDLTRESQSLKAVCAKCHNLQIVTDTPRSFDEWHDTVQAMVDGGATGTDAQFDDVMDYLHRTMTTINVNSAAADELKIVLDLPETVAQEIINRRGAQKFSDLADLKSVSGINVTTVDAKALFIFFK